MRAEVVQQPPTASVILPTFNRAGYLREAIASVLAQTLQDFEVLVVDDGSTDDTPSVVASFGDSRIRYFYQENLGRSAARNLGLTNARGAFVALLDDDDLYLPHKLEVQVAFLTGRPAVDLVGAGTQLVDESGKLKRIWRTWQDQPELTAENCLRACPLPLCTVLFRRDMLGLLDHWFDTKMDRAEDTDFFVRLLLAGCRMAWLPDVVSAYRLHAANSQGDATRYGQGYQRLLEKVFARPDLPEALRLKEAELYALYSLVGACHAYAAGQYEEAQESLAQAMELAPDLGEGTPPPFAETIATFACRDLVTMPHRYIDLIFDHLPRDLGHLSRYRPQAHSAYHMRAVFAAHSRGEQVSLRDWLLGVYYHPHWLANRGVWSILVSCKLPFVRGRG